jgi:type I restriction enzyme S subunit
MSTNQGCKGLVPYRDISSVFFAYVLSISTELLNNLGKGTTFLEISGDELGRFPAAFPTFPEQTQIARFLDHETAKIDTLIHEQKRLIELLKEKRQAVISHAVTKGLDPDVPMKDSGVEWLGEVPAHWSVQKCSYIGRLFGSEPIPDDMVSSEEGLIPFLKVASLSSGNTDVASWDWYVSDHYLGTLRPVKRFVVFPKRGAAIFLNKVNVVNCKAVIDPNLMGWEILGNNVTEYFAHTLKCRVLSELADVSTVPQINNKHVAPERFPVPPTEEQQEIVDFLSINIQAMDELNIKATESIALLTERRSALISAAVTGKIDVRNWQPPANESAFEGGTPDEQEATV